MSEKNKIAVLIDDDEDDQLIFHTLISKYFSNYQLEGFTSFEKAKPFIGSEGKTIDALFIDFNMPKFNGLDCLRFLRSQVEFQNKKIIIYSTSKNPDDAKMCMQEGATDFMIKPSRVNEWVTVLGEYLEE